MSSPRHHWVDCQRSVQCGWAGIRTADTKQKAERKLCPKCSGRVKAR